jgi:hypothetical protein
MGAVAEEAVFVMGSHSMLPDRPRQVNFDQRSQSARGGCPQSRA